MTTQQEQEGKEQGCTITKTVQWTEGQQYYSHTDRAASPPSKSRRERRKAVPLHGQFSGLKASSTTVILTAQRDHPARAGGQRARLAQHGQGTEACSKKTEGRQLSLTLIWMRPVIVTRQRAP